MIEFQFQFDNHNDIQFHIQFDNLIYSHFDFVTDIRLRFNKNNISNFI